MMKVGIFDIGGVLIETKLDVMYADIQHTLGISRQVFEDVYPKLIYELSIGLYSEDVFWQNFIIQTNASGRLPKESLFKRIYHQGNFILHQALLDYCSLLKNRGMSLAILSNNIPSHVELAHEWGITKLFDYQFFSNEIGLRKPDPAFYRHALDRLKVLPEESFFVDDLTENIDTANNLDIHGILHTSSQSTIKQIQSLIINVS